MGGALDEIVEEQNSGRKFRRCNWVRFVRTSGNSETEANARLVTDASGQVVFEVTAEVISPGTELVVSFGNDHETKENRFSANLLLANAMLLKAISTIMSGN